MGKMIFDEYDDKPMLPAVAENHDIITANTIASVGKVAADMVEPLFGIVNRALTLIPDILNCIATIIAEYEKTRQVKIQVKGQIELAKQETERLRIQEKELTIRTLGEHKKEIQLKEIELKQLKIELSHKKHEMKVKHTEYLKTLAPIEQAMQECMKTSNMIRKQIPQVIHDDVKLHEILTQLNYANHTVAGFASAIVALRNGGAQ